MLLNKINKLLPIAILVLLLQIMAIPVAIASDIDYSQTANWAVIKDNNFNTDVFFVCPTVFKGTENSYNMPIDDNTIKAHFVGAIKMEQDIYDNTCNFYAPYYRQAALATYAKDYNSMEQYYQVAYQDVKAAFLYYLKHYNKGKPFILAGFSQGSDMLLRLMKDVLADTKINNSLVAAYLIGWRVTPDDLRNYPHLKMAQSKNDLSVIISFNCEAPNIQTSLIVPEYSLSINPLTWSTDHSIADKSLNKGAVLIDPSGITIKKIPNLTGAYIDNIRGTLKVPDINEDEYPSILPGVPKGIYHVYDYMFFYNNLKENVQLRQNTYQQNLSNAA